jgi:hypothetical protein
MLLIPTLILHVFDLDCFQLWVAIWFYIGIKNNLLGLMVLDKW